ncbi:response regulator [Halobacteriovorax sp. GB3]|uniref:hybrid sensor histidine kinase/response regulator n=1 Tax=Halobacteriovorax sp. GB3 TaxID=2719615 RepID=UPI0023623F5F|nr:hybrid sensor histidine kinase/response regulator [Halobacteriovorax sp. GB3]MDD0852815.1 response regulator [Halobacteriovorax sp. GB3]
MIVEKEVIPAMLSNKVNQEIEIGNNVVSKLHAKIIRFETLARTLAKIGKSKIQDETVLKKLLVETIDYDQSLSIAGGGIWYEPYAYDSKKRQKSFFLARNEDENLQFIDDYNIPSPIFDKERFEKDRDYRREFLHSPGYHNENWYVTASFLKRSSRTIWSNAYTDPHSLEPMVTVSAPIIENDKFIGVATIDVRLSWLTLFLSEVNSSNVKTQLFDKDDNRIIKNPLAKKKEETVERLLTKIETTIKDNNNYSKEETETIKQKLLKNTYNLNNKAAFFYALSILNIFYDNHQLNNYKLYNETNQETKVLYTTFLVPYTYWKIIRTVPLKESFARTYETKNNIQAIFLILTILLTILAITGLRKLVFSPMNKIREKMAMMAGKIKSQDNLDEVEPIRIKGLARELHEFTSSYNKLLTLLQEKDANLKKSLSSLEQTVQRQKDTEKELLYSAKSKAHFLANISHEIRTPLNILLGAIELVHENKMNKEQLEYFQMIKNSGENIKSVVAKILYLAKIDHSTNIKLEEHYFNLRKTFEEINALMRIHASELNLTYDVEIDPLLEFDVMGDETRINQVFTNLISNAIKYTDEGKIHISLKRYNTTNANKEGFLLTVADTGIGIPKKQLDSLFLPFSQRAIQEVVRNGLGLQVSRSIIEALGGEIHASSEIGIGTTIVVKFELNRVQKDKMIEEEMIEKTREIKFRKRSENDKFNILIAEDTEDNRKLLDFYFKDTEFKIQFAENGKRAVELFELNEYDLIIMDMQMPVMDGYEATKLITKLKKERNILTPIIGLSAKSFDEDIQRGLKAGCTEYIAKPIKKKSLMKKIFKYAS